MIQEEAALPGKRTRDQISKRIDIDYFGYRDEDNGGAMLEAELQAEQAGVCVYWCNLS